MGVAYPGMYIGECMILIVNINNGCNEPIHGHQNCNSSQMLIFGGYINVRECLYTRVLFVTIPF